MQSLVHSKRYCLPADLSRGYDIIKMGLSHSTILKHYIIGLKASIQDQDTHGTLILISTSALSLHLSSSRNIYQLQREDILKSKVIYVGRPANSDLQIR